MPRPRWMDREKVLLIMELAGEPTSLAAAFIPGVAGLAETGTTAAEQAWATEYNQALNEAFENPPESMYEEVLKERVVDNIEPAAKLLEVQGAGLSLAAASAQSSGGDIFAESISNAIEARYDLDQELDEAANALVQIKNIIFSDGAKLAAFGSLTEAGGPLASTAYGQESEPAFEPSIKRWAFRRLLPKSLGILGLDRVSESASKLWG